ncbi:MAG: glycosyltransferase, partial [Candidatus Omnitrophota bacterium]
VITNLNSVETLGMDPLDESNKDNIVLLRYVPLEELTVLYNLSSLFVYPSLYEGFGFPPLEAMASGVPVLASNTSCLPEIIGSAGLLVDPYNEDEMAEGMYSLLIDKELRNTYISRGIKKAAEFAWQKTAGEMLNIYKDLAGR